jgi:hypothetical protein
MKQHRPSAIGEGMRLMNGKQNVQASDIRPDESIRTGNNDPLPAPAAVNKKLKTYY